MKRMILMALVVLLASPSWAEPYIGGVSSKDHYGYTVTFDASTSDSAGMNVGPVQCSVTFVLSGSGTVSLYQVPDSSTAASSGTLVRSFTSSTATPYTFSPGLPHLKAVSSSASADGSVMTIRCSNTQVSSGGGGSGTVNTAVDRDDDGLADYYHFVGTGTATDAEDVNAALALMVDNPNLFEISGIVDSSLIDESADMTWDSTNLIEIPANTTVKCNANSRIYGPALSFWQDRGAATRHISNATGADNIHIQDCFIENTELLGPFDANPSGIGWDQTSLFGGVHIIGCSGCSVTGTTVRGTPHSPFFMTTSANTTFAGNYAYTGGETFNHEGTVTTLSDTEPAGETSLNLTAALGNCAVDDWIMIELDTVDPLAKNGTDKHWAAGWVEATGDPITIRRAALATGRSPGLPSQASAGNRVFCSEGDKHGFETYCQESTVCSDNSIIGNRAEFVSGTAFQIRGVDLNAGECEDNTQVTCWHDRTLVSGNTGVDIAGDLLMVRGSRNATLKDNLGFRSGGVLFTASDLTCLEEFDTGNRDGQLECSSNTRLSGNVIQDAAPNSGSSSSVNGLIRFNPGHDNIDWDRSNMVDGLLRGTAYAILGDLTGSTLNMRAKNVGGVCLGDGITTGDPITKPITGSLECTWFGLQATDGTSVPGVFWRAAHSASLTLDPFIMTGPTGQVSWLAPAVGDMVAPTFRNVQVTGHSAGYSGTFATVAARDAAVQCDATREGLVTIVQDDTGDCVTGGSSTENRCRCNGSAWVDYAVSTSKDVFEFDVGSSRTVSGGGVFGGTITNALGGSSNRFLSSGGTSTGVIDGFSFVDLALRRGAEGLMAAETITGIDEHNATFSDLTVRGLIWDGIADNLRYNGHPSNDFSGFSGASNINDIDTPSGACSSGARYTEIDAASAPTTYVCINDTTWTRLD